MNEVALKDFFLGKATIDKLRENFKTDQISKSVPIVELSINYLVTCRDLVRLCDAVLAERHLRKYGREASKINIHTQGLNDVNPFGLNIFNRSPMNKNNYRDRIAFSGDKAPFFVRPRANLSL